MSVVLHVAAGILASGRLLPASIVVVDFAEARGPSSSDGLRLPKSVCVAPVLVLLLWAAAVTAVLGSGRIDLGELW